MFDEYNFDELLDMTMDSIVCGECSECGACHDIEPDAEGYDCSECGASGTVSSPLVDAGLI